jgi:hypothetical protein
MASERPQHQRWIKRPPRPSRSGPELAPARQRPGMTQFVLAIMVGIGGLFAGVGLAGGFIAVWRSIGGTRQDIRDLFR